MNTYLIYFLIFLAAFNSYVNIKLVRSEVFERFQKIAQSILIWLLPIIGAAVVLYIIKDNDRKPPPSSRDRNYANDSLPGGVQ